MKGIILQIAFLQLLPGAVARLKAQCIPNYEQRINLSVNFQDNRIALRFPGGLPQGLYALRMQTSDMDVSNMVFVR